MDTGSSRVTFRGTLRAEMEACIRRLQQLTRRHDRYPNPSDGPLHSNAAADHGFNGRSAAVDLIRLLLSRLGKPACRCHATPRPSYSREANAGMPCACGGGPDVRGGQLLGADRQKLAEAEMLIPDKIEHPELQAILAVTAALVFPPSAVVGPSDVPVSQYTVLPVRGWPCSPEYGKWCGNCRTSFPADTAVDAVDLVCKQHDICLHLHGHACHCDQAFLAGMGRAIGAPGVSAEGRAYGLGAIVVLANKPCFCIKKFLGTSIMVWGLGGHCPF